MELVNRKSPLPVDVLLPEIISSLQRDRNLVVEAPPGAGKTTRVPPALLGIVGGEVVVLEPRRIAARLAARRVAWELGEQVGETVGYQVRFEEAIGPRTRLAFTDLQDMQNHMRETIDAGMGDLQAKQGKGGLPAAPPSAQVAPVPAAVAAAAPPPDTNAAAEITEQTKAADQAEQEVASAAPPSGPSDQGAAAPIAPPPPPPAAPPTIALGQTVDQVTAGMGAPTRIIDLGTKKIYVYRDMKVTFKAGKVSDVE